MANYAAVCLFGPQVVSDAIEAVEMNEAPAILKRQRETGLKKWALIVPEGEAHHRLPHEAVACSDSAAISEIQGPDFFSRFALKMAAHACSMRVHMCINGAEALDRTGGCGL